MRQFFIRIGFTMGMTKMASVFQQVSGSFVVGGRQCYSCCCCCSPSLFLFCKHFRSRLSTLLSCHSYSVEAWRLFSLFLQRFSCVVAGTKCVAIWPFTNNHLLFVWSHFNAYRLRCVFGLNLVTRYGWYRFHHLSKKQQQTIDTSQSKWMNIVSSMLFEFYFSRSLFSSCSSQWLVLNSSESIHLSYIKAL